MKAIAEVPEIPEIPQEPCWNCDRLLCECGNILHTAFLTLGAIFGIAAAIVSGWLFWLNVKAWLA